MTKQQLKLFLFPPITETEPLETEIITNKKFILMVGLTISMMIIAKTMEVLLK